MRPSSTRPKYHYYNDLDGRLVVLSPAGFGSRKASAFRSPAPGGNLTHGTYKSFCRQKVRFGTTDPVLAVGEELSQHFNVILRRCEHLRKCLGLKRRLRLRRRQRRPEAQPLGDPAIRLAEWRALPRKLQSGVGGHSSGRIAAASRRRWMTNVSTTLHTASIAASWSAASIVGPLVSCRSRW